jgi:hypothetical protein
MGECLGKLKLKLKLRGESESKLLAAEFLCTLQPTDSEVLFRLFEKDFLSHGNSLASF